MSPEKIPGMIHRRTALFRVALAAVVNYHAVICGISDYQGSANDLTYCDDDAYDLRDALLAGSNWTSANVNMLIDGAATRSGIQSAIQQMGARADADDVCLFYFSGHGTTGSDAAPSTDKALASSRAAPRLCAMARVRSARSRASSLRPRSMC